MKGIIFNLFEETVRQHHGEGTWDALLEDTGSHGAFTSLGSYPDAALIGLVDAAGRRLGRSREELLRWFGRHALGLLAQRFPEFFAGHRSTNSFLKTLNNVVHVEVVKVYPGARTPHFDVAEEGDRLLLGYRSERRLCALAEGFVEGSADHYREQVSIERPECTLRGGARCVLACRFSRT